MIPLVEADILMENNRDELVLFLTYPEIFNMNITAYQDYITQSFEKWPINPDTGKTTAEAINAQYASVTQASVPRSYYDLQSDYGIYCPSVQTGQAWLQGNPNAKVYVSEVFQPPKTPFMVYPTDYPGQQLMIDPFHLWDWVSATGSWNFFESPQGPIFGGPGGPVSAYNPTAEDQSFGAMLRKQWYDFFVNGTIENVGTINSALNFPTNYSVAVQGSTAWTSQHTNNFQWRNDYCQNLKDYGLNPDSRFWWVN